MDAASSRVDWPVPSWERNARLEDVLGVRLSEVSWADIEGLVERGVPEDQSIDFKGAWYALDKSMAAEVLPHGSEEKRAERIKEDRIELPRDASAFANAAGGLIVIGVVERGGRANRLLPVRLTDARRRAMTEYLMAGTTPYIQGVEVGFVWDPAEESQGCVLVYVPASSAAPHALTQAGDKRFGWVVRDGSQKVWLSEPQVAAAFRDRFAGRASLRESVAAVYDAGVNELSRLGRCWLAVALVPAQPARPRPLSRDVQEELQKATRRCQEALPGQPLGDLPGFGRGRVVLRDSVSAGLGASGSATVSDHVLHLYTDGRAFAAVRLEEAEESAFTYAELPAETVGIRLESLTLWMVHLMGAVAGHAVHVAASGEFEVQAGIVTGYPDDPFLADGLPADNKPNPHAVVNQSMRWASPHVMAGSRTVESVEPARTTVSPAVGVDAREVLTVAAQLVTELVSEFGALPNDPLLTLDGLVVAEACQTGQGQWLERWARFADENLVDDQQI